MLVFVMTAMQNTLYGGIFTMTRKLKGRVMNNITHKLASILLAFSIILTFSSCNTEVNPSTATNSQVYSDYSFWEKDNQVRITLPIDVVSMEDDTSDIKSLDTLNLSEQYLNRTIFLKEAMISYFSEEYSIDISKKLEKQKLRAFKADSSNLGTMGYVDIDNPDYLNLNSILFTQEYDVYFDNTYIHETLHQIGFRSIDGPIITEGITEALTDLILRKANVLSYPTPNYSQIRTLSYQILSVDKDIVKFYLENENPSISTRITNALENVNKPFLKVNPGKRLESLYNGITYGFTATFEPYYLAFEAQEIVRSYCQTFNPDTKTIDYIRNHYLVLDYETVTITEVDGAYKFTN